MLNFTKLHEAVSDYRPWTMVDICARIILAHQLKRAWMVPRETGVMLID